VFCLPRLRRRGTRSTRASELLDSPLDTSPPGTRSFPAFPGQFASVHSSSELPVKYPYGPSSPTPEPPATREATRPRPTQTASCICELGSAPFTAIPRRAR
jgi:hypothetical protein